MSPTTGSPQSATAAAVRAAPPPGRRWPVLISVLVLVTAVGWLLVTRSFGGPGSDPAALAQTELIEKAGVKVVRVVVTGGGGLVDLRYQVLDPDKALSIHDPKTPPTLVDERTGQKLQRPIMGHMGHSVPKAGRTYYVIFDNTRYALAPGRTVTVTLGGAHLEDVAVG